jgi:hypothetical protein
MVMPAVSVAASYIRQHQQMYQQPNNNFTQQHLQQQPQQQYQQQYQPQQQYEISPHNQHVLNNILGSKTDTFFNKRPIAAAYGGSNTYNTLSMESSNNNKRAYPSSFAQKASQYSIDPMVINLMEDQHAINEQSIKRNLERQSEELRASGGPTKAVTKF